MRLPNNITLPGAIARSFETAKKKGKIHSVEELADLIDYPRYRLNKVFDCSDSSSLPVSKLIPFMRALGNYIVLQFIARRCGYALYRIPRSAEAAYEDIPKLQEKHRKTLLALNKFYAGEISIGKLHDTIDKNIGQLAAHRKGAEKAGLDEQEFLFDPEEDEDEMF